MVIHHTGGLHMGIANGRTKKLKAAFFHVLAYRVGYWGAGGQLVAVVVDGFAIGHKAVQVFIKRAKLLLHLYK